MLRSVPPFTRALGRGAQKTGQFISPGLKESIWYIMTDGTTPAPTQLFTFEREASRLELLIRIAYWILIGIVACIYGIIAIICLIIQWFHILIFGTRHEGLSNFAKGYLEYIVHVMSYTYIMNDKRPTILPVPVRVYEEEVQNP
ncbi:MAG: DUF4389 domain-containing protein [Methanoregula sp.]|uniref:DUF4389 domain-containing protein n=1 Tax=Methanoregula sp. TaxID=2052170 RepID=UPI003C293C65